MLKDIILECKPAFLSMNDERGVNKSFTLKTKRYNFLSDLSDHISLDAAQMRHIRDADRSNTAQPTAGVTGVDLCVN